MKITEEQAMGFLKAAVTKHFGAVGDLSCSADMKERITIFGEGFVAGAQCLTELLEKEAAIKKAAASAE